MNKNEFNKSFKYLNKAEVDYWSEKTTPIFNLVSANDDPACSMEILRELLEELRTRFHLWEKNINGDKSKRLDYLTEKLGPSPYSYVNEDLAHFWAFSYKSYPLVVYLSDSNFGCQALFEMPVPLATEMMKEFFNYLESKD